MNYDREFPTKIVFVSLVIDPRFVHLIELHNATNMCEVIHGSTIKSYIIEKNNSWQSNK